LRDVSEWVAFIDVDEFIAPSSQAPKSSFVDWLASQPDEVDSLYLRWVAFPVPDYDHKPGQALFRHPLTFAFTHRFTDVQIQASLQHSSGKSLIRPKFFPGPNTIHHFVAENWEHYEATKHKLVPSSPEVAGKSGVRLPERCGVRKSARRCDDCCRRTDDSFFLSHYRRHKTKVPKQEIPKPGGRLSNNYIPVTTRNTEDGLTPDYCRLILDLCESAASIREFALEAHRQDQSRYRQLAALVTDWTCSGFERTVQESDP